MTFSKTILDRRFQLVAVATAMLEERLNLIEGIREICVLRHHVNDPENKVFITIRAIESETDHFPIGKMRDYCEANYLQQIDAERDQYLAGARRNILLACEKIVQVFSKDP